MAAALTAALVSCSFGSEPGETADQETSVVAPSTSPGSSLPPTSIEGDEPTIDPPGLESLYEQCLATTAFDPGSVQVLISETGQPWWVETGQDVPADLHGPCLVEIGGEPDGLSSWGDPGRPPDECVALVGSEPWVTLFESRLTPSCVVVAEDQNLQVWNKGYDTLTVEWFDGSRELRSDNYFETGAVGSVIEAGPTQVDSSPYPMPIIWLMPAEASPSAGLVKGEDSFGPVVVGMTLGEATEALGLPIEIDVNLLPGPVCLGAVIVGDPYSPLFIVRTEADEASSVISSIETEQDFHRCG